MSEVEREYEYKTSWNIILLSGGMFGLAAAFFAHLARTNDRGLIIDRIIELDQGRATAFFWILCFLALCFVAMSIAMVFQRDNFHQRIAFTSMALLVPVSRWSADEKVIPYEDISEVFTTEVQGQQFLRLMHSGGTASIMASMLPSKEAFEEVRNLLTERVQQAQKRELS